MKISEMFKPGIIRPTVGGRVRHNQTQALGTVEGRAKINGSTTVWVLNVKYDDGQVALMVPENEFIAVSNNTPAETQRQQPIKPAAVEPETISMGLGSSSYSDAETDEVITRGF